MILKVASNLLESHHGSRVPEMWKWPQGRQQQYKGKDNERKGKDTGRGRKKDLPPMQPPLEFVAKTPHWTCSGCGCADNWRSRLECHKCRQFCGSKQRNEVLLEQFAAMDASKGTASTAEKDKKPDATTPLLGLAERSLKYRY